MKKLDTQLFRYSIVILSLSLCLGLGLIADIWAKQSIDVYLLFLIAVIVSSWSAGMRAGFITAACSVVIIIYFFVPPMDTFLGKPWLTMIISTVLFLLIACWLSFLLDSQFHQERIILSRKKEKDLHEKIISLEKALSHAQNEIASRDEFLAIASHELKTPLTTVLLQIQTTLHNIRNVSLAEFSVEHMLQMLNSMQIQTKRLAKMINDLLNISLITTHKMELELEDMDLTTLTRNAVEDFMQKSERGSGLILVEGNESIIGRWDKLRMEQAIDNLLSNAIKYGNKKQIDVTVKKQGNEAILSISDHGIGISPEDSEKIFELFKRGDGAQSYKGLGIGLYITQQIVSMHGGRIELKSKMGSGTTFSLHLPIQKGPTR